MRRCASIASLQIGPYDGRFGFIKWRQGTLVSKCAKCASHEMLSLFFKAFRLMLRLLSEDNPEPISLEEPRSTVGGTRATEVEEAEDLRLNDTLPQDVPASSGADVDNKGFILTRHTERHVNRHKRRIQALEDAGLDGKRIQDVIAALEEEDSLAEDLVEVQQARTQKNLGEVEEPGSTEGEQEEGVVLDEEIILDKDEQEKTHRLAEQTQKAEDLAKPHPEKKKKKRPPKPPPTEWERQVHEEGAKAHGRRLEADLRRSGLDESEIASIMKRRAATDKTRPVYTKIALKHIAPETLNRYDMPWEFDEQVTFGMDTSKTLI